MTVTLQDRQKRVLRRLCKADGTLEPGWFKALSRNPELLASGAPSRAILLQDTVDCLQAMGATAPQAFRILAEMPIELATNATALANYIEEFERATLAYKVRWTKVMQLFPQAITAPSALIVQRVEYLLCFFVKGNIRPLLENSPNVLFEDEGGLQDKIEYLLYDMKVGLSSIANTGALGCSLDYIRQRHLFLKKSGLYYLPPENTLSIDIEAKPAIGDVLAGSDDKYLKVAAKGIFSLRDYEMFLRVLRLEDEEGKTGLGDLNEETAPHEADDEGEEQEDDQLR